MIGCHPVSPKARIIVLLGWGRGRGSYIPPFWEGGGLRVGEGMGGMSAIASPKKVRDGKLPPRHPHGRDHRPC